MDEPTSPASQIEQGQHDTNSVANSTPSGSQTSPIPSAQTNQPPQSQLPSLDPVQSTPSTTATNNSPPDTQQPTPPPSPPSHKSPFSPLPIILFLILLFIGGLIIASRIFTNALKKSQVNTISQQLTPTQPELTLVHGVLSIGVDATYPPMESAATDSGQLIGYDIDLGKRIAQELGVTPVFKITPFDNIFDNLNKKQYDIIISSVTITDERKQKYDFSDQYLNAGEVIITRKENATIKTPADLANKKVGVEKGTQEEIQAAKYTAQNLIVTYKDNAPAIADLIANKLDAVLTDLPNAKGIVDKNPSLKIASDPFTTEYYGIVFRKGDTMLEDRINHILVQLKQTGFLTDLKHSWLE